MEDPGFSPQLAPNIFWVFMICFHTVLRLCFAPPSCSMSVGRRAISAKWLRRFFGLWGPYLGAGIRVKKFSDDFRHVVVSLKHRWYNDNFVGTHYGGSLFSMTDPFYMMMLLRNLGPDYMVWDKKASIEFVKAVRTEVSAEFRLTEDRIREIIEKTDSGEPHNANFTVDVTDGDGEVVAKVDKIVYIRRKKGR